MRSRSLSLVLLLSCVLPVRAEEDFVTQARRHFERGRVAYEAHRYAEAIEEFKAGNVIAPRPAFLLNIGQAHRALLELDEARAAYRAYLAAVPADDPERPKVERLVADIDRALAARAAPHEVLVRAPPPPRPFIARHWWIIPVSAVGAAGLAVGLYFALRPHDPDCADARFGCLDLPR